MNPIEQPLSQKTPDEDALAKIARIESLIRNDPGDRGLLAARHAPLGLGELAAAAHSLAETGQHAILLTGFYIASADPPCGETDGPPGAVALAMTLADLRIATTLLTDTHCEVGLRAAMQAADLPPESLLVAQSTACLTNLLGDHLDQATHLIAIERAGPTHDEASIRALWGNDIARRFSDSVPREHWKRFLNMRGVAIDDWTVDFSPLFDSRRDGLVTVGIADGGNEIGCGKFLWEDLVARLPATGGPGILARTSCDHVILAGTSNWGALGLAAATALLRDSTSAFTRNTPESQTRILEAMVQDQRAVDGVTRLCQPTVDGLPPEVYLSVLQQIRAILGLG